MDLKPTVKRDLKDWNISKEIALDRSAWRLAINVPELWTYFFRVSSLAYPNLLGKKGYVEWSGVNFWMNKMYIMDHVIQTTLKVQWPEIILDKMEQIPMNLSFFCGVLLFLWTIICKGLLTAQCASTLPTSQTRGQQRISRLVQAALILYISIKSTRSDVTYAQW